eukprot:98863-Rhodomonas_salina.1
MKERERETGEREKERRSELVREGGRGREGERQTDRHRWMCEGERVIFSGWGFNVGSDSGSTFWFR